MTQKWHLKNSAIFSILAFILLAIATFFSAVSVLPSGQEQFEVISDVTTYSSLLSQADSNLRIVLFIDALFALSYSSAIGFAVLAFAKRNPPFAWLSGLGVLIVMSLDYLENIVMVQSMDLLKIKESLPLEHILFQVSISSIKWHAAAALLFAISFLLPDKMLIEKILVWGTRLGLAIAVPLFVINPLSLRDLGALSIPLSMASGFILLAMVTWQRTKNL